jgi:hypothetical protein
MGGQKHQKSFKIALREFAYRLPFKTIYDPHFLLAKSHSREPSRPFGRPFWFLTLLTSTLRDFKDLV